MKTKKSFLWLAFLILATIWILATISKQTITISKGLYSEQYTTSPTNMTVT